MAVWTLSDPVDVVDTALTVCVLAHEVDCWQTELSLAQVTSFLVVEIDRGLFHLGDLRLTVADFAKLFI